MKRILVSFVSLCVAIVMLTVTGVIGFRYPRIVENDPLVAPVQVRSVDADRLVLSDGRVLVVGYVENLEDRVKASGFRVDVEDARGETLVYVKRRNWICGTPWACSIRIRLIPDYVPLNRRELISTAKSERAKGR